MAELTDHYDLTAMSAGDDFSDDGYKYTLADRHRIDYLAWLGAEGHHHNGSVGSVVEPEDGLDIELETTGGTIPSGATVYYKFTWVNANGEESAASVETFITTPAAISEPSSPVLSFTTTGGVLHAGNYYYVLTSYTGASINETKALNPNHITIPATTGTNEITLTLPEPDDAQTGYNVYRRAPGQSKYFFLASVETNVATPPTVFVDDGSVEDDCDRTLPKFNTTNSANSITLTLPGATPAVPELGYTWKIYRTLVPGVWTSSFLVHVVEGISEGSEIVTPTYIDIGSSTTSGSPPATSQQTSSPSKIMLTDMEEVQGSLPLSGIAFPFQHTFQYAGPLDVEPVQGSAPFVCEFPNVEIVYCRASLGRGSTPAADDVIVDINKAAAHPSMVGTYSTIYTTQANRPKVLVGDQFGTPTTPDVILLERGDSLTMDIDQVGGGATPSDRDLVVTVWMIGYGLPTTSYVEGTSGGTGGDF